MLRAGDKIGPYVLIRKLGKGGFGEVWLAEEQDTIMAAQVALKIPFDEDADIDAVKKEATVWVKASGHPNVLPIHKAAQYDAQLVLISEYAPGGSLKDWLKTHGGKAPSIESAIKITSGILAGLQHLHSQGIIHRDLKPDNVLMQGEEPRLSDFGVAAVLKSTVHSFTLAGTPPYMAPEAFQKERDEQTDIWSVGVMLYELLSGRLPFSQTDLILLIGAITNNEPPPLAVNVPESLQEVTACALQKEPANRYKTVAEMCEALRGVMRKLERQKEQQEAQTLLITPNPAPPKSNQSALFVQTDGTAQNQAMPEANRPQPPANPVNAPPSSLLATGLVSPPTPLPALSSTTLESVSVAEPKRSRRLWIIGGIIILLVMTILVFLARPKPTGEPPNEVINSIASEMVQIPGGQFLMGSPDEEAGRYDNEELQHSVTISGFYMGKYEVTQAQWRAVAGLPPVKTDLKDPAPSKFKGDNLPVEKVNWDEAVEFCARLSQATGKTYRLPTEAEWEYACRAGTTTAFSVGDSLSSEQANFNGNYPYGNAPKGKWLQRTVEVGSYQPNAWGLYNMHGNVWEWCWDWYGDYSQSPNADPTGPSTGSDKVFRGGSWDSVAEFARSANRGKLAPHIPYNAAGFRLVRTDN
jgi:formylglycine-generating enzyme required for sulfatase activity